jgi:hypothetical protein
VVSLTTNENTKGAGSTHHPNVPDAFWVLNLIVNTDFEMGRSNLILVLLFMVNFK